MNTFVTTPQFDAWLTALRDAKVKARVIARIRSAEFGNFGDVEAVGSGISELRVHVGPGFRVYFCRRGGVLYILLCGGDKSTQSRDIKRAKSILKDLDTEHDQNT